MPYGPAYGAKECLNYQRLEGRSGSDLLVILEGLNMDNAWRQDLSRGRVIRVFVSSTFRDMQDERKYLAEHVYQELLSRCRSRRVDLVFIDLRWGINDEQARGGEVLPICLAEIDNCRPFFIGILGERYGWVPESPDRHLLAEHGLEEQIGKSVTEMEMIYGALSNPQVAETAFFYFRDPAYIEKIPNKDRADFLPEGEGHRAKLKDLKNRVRASGLSLDESYASPEEVGSLILWDLWEAIDAAFPDSEALDRSDQEASEHEAFALSRATVYVAREEYLRALDAQADQDGPPLVLVGESGVGKSALVSNWYLRRREANPDQFMILHSIGNSPDSTSHVEIIRRIMREIKRQYRVGDEIPTDSSKLTEALPQWFAYASAGGGVVLILDGLNQMEDDDNASRLEWLPEYLPPRVRLIASALPGPALETAEYRGWSKLEVRPLTVEERRSLVERWGKLHGKHLTTGQIERTIAARQCGNPLFLRTLLDELRVFRRFPGLENTGSGIDQYIDQCIDRYLKAGSPAGLFALVLDRWEESYSRDNSDLVRNALSFLWAGRRGLYESELLELLKEAKSLHRTDSWSRFRVGVGESLVNRSGYLNFSHDYLRQAVERRYLSTTEARRLEHIRLADFFEKRETDTRQADELPWQLEKAGEWARLRNCLRRIPMFLELYITHNKEPYKTHNEYELVGYWLQLEKQHYDLVECYMGELADYEQGSPSPEDLARILNYLGEFFNDNGRYAGAEQLLRRALKIRVDVLNGKHQDIARTLSNLANLLHAKGDFAGAEPLYRRALRGAEEVWGPKHPETASALNNLATLLESKADYSEAEPLYRRALEIQEKVLGPKHTRTALTLNNLASLLHSRGDHSGAVALHRRVLAIREEVLGPRHPDTAQSMNNLTLPLYYQGEHDEVESLVRRALEISEDALGPKHPTTATSLNNLGFLLYSQGDPAEAETLHRRALTIREEALGPRHPDTAQSLNNLGLVLFSKGDHAGTEPLFRRALEIREEALGAKHPDTAQSQFNLGVLLHGRGDKVGAEPPLRRALEIREEVLGQRHPDTAESLHALGLLLCLKGEVVPGEPLLRRGYLIAEELLGPMHPATVKYRKDWELVQQALD